MSSDLMKAKRYHQNVKATSGANEMKAIETKVAADMATRLGPGEFQMFVDELDKVIADPAVHYLNSDDVAFIFVWNTTSQGHEFWSQYHHIQRGYK